MLSVHQAFIGCLYSLMIISLVLIDYVLGNGFVNVIQNVLCHVNCFVRNTIREEAKLTEMTVTEIPLNLPGLLTEILMLLVTIIILNRYKNFRFQDRIDELLKESKDALRETDDYIEKWRLRRISWQVPTEYSFLDEEPQEINSLNLEVPILHMAIVDTLGASHSQPARGDAGDTANITDCTLLSVTSLLEDDLLSISEPTSEERYDDFNNQYMWDVVEDVGNDIL